MPNYLERVVMAGTQTNAPALSPILAPARLPRTAWPGVLSPAGLAPGDAAPWGESPGDPTPAPPLKPAPRETGHASRQTGSGPLGVSRMVVATPASEAPPAVRNNPAPPHLAPAAVVIRAPKSLRPAFASSRQPQDSPDPNAAIPASPRAFVVSEHPEHGPSGSGHTEIRRAALPPVSDPHGVPESGAASVRARPHEEHPVPRRAGPVPGQRSPLPSMPPRGAGGRGQITIGRIEVEVHTPPSASEIATPPPSPTPNHAWGAGLDVRFLQRFQMRP